jgi:hypothetical protein
MDRINGRRSNVTHHRKDFIARFLIDRLNPTAKGRHHRKIQIFRFQTLGQKISRGRFNDLSNVVRMAIIGRKLGKRRTHGND